MKNAIKCAGRCKATMAGTKAEAVIAAKNEGWRYSHLYDGLVCPKCRTQKYRQMRKAVTDE